MSTCKRMWTDREIRSMADESAKIRIEAGLTENAKPVYCHPVLLYNGSAQNRMMCLIFNNDDTPFTNESLFEYILANESLRVMLNGIYQGVQTLYAAKASDISINLVFVNLEQPSGVGSQVMTKSAFTTTFPSADDSVHKVN